MYPAAFELLREGWKFFDSGPVVGPFVHQRVIEPVVDAVLAGHQSCEHRGAAGGAHGVDAVGIGKTGAAFRKRVDIWGLQFGVA